MMVIALYSLYAKLYILSIQYFKESNYYYFLSENEENEDQEG